MIPLALRKVMFWEIKIVSSWCLWIGGLQGHLSALLRTVCSPSLTHLCLQLQLPYFSQ